MLPVEWIQRIQRLQIRTRKMVSDSLTGEYQSTFKGRGMEFEEARIYQPGDDVRAIDWNITARTGIPHIKIFREERQLTLLLMIDVSGSLGFGSQPNLKRDRAAEISSLIAHIAMNKNDQVGALLFSDRVEKFIPPKKGRPHLWRLIREILTYKSVGQGTSFKTAFDFVNTVQKKKSIVFCVSDFFDDAFLEPMKITAKHHDMISVLVRDPMEETLPTSGYWAMEDAETHKVKLVNCSDRGFRSRFAQVQKENKNQLVRDFKRYGIDMIDVSTHDSMVHSLELFFRNRLLERAHRG